MTVFQLRVAVALYTGNCRPGSAGGGGSDEQRAVYGRARAREREQTVLHRYNRRSRDVAQCVARRILRAVPVLMLLLLLLLWLLLLLLLYTKCSISPAYHPANIRPCRKTISFYTIELNF